MYCFLNPPELICIVEILNNATNENMEGEEIEGSVLCSQTARDCVLGLPLSGL